MSQILIYTFNARYNTSYQVLRSLQLDIDKAYIWGSINIPKQVYKNILEGKYTHILGLGDYRRNAKFLRIETKFVNQFGKQKILENGDEYISTTWQLPELPGTIISDKTTIGPCNNSAYSLLSLIAKHGLATKLAFVHVPKSTELGLVNGMVEQWIRL